MIGSFTLSARTSRIPVGKAQRVRPPVLSAEQGALRHHQASQPTANKSGPGSTTLHAVGGNRSHTDNRVARRDVLLGVTVAGCLTPLKAFADSGDWSSPGLAAKEDPTMPKFVKLDSGVRYQILSEGSQGIEADNGDTVELDYVLRRNNGYFIYSTVEGVSFQPKDLPIGPIDVHLGAGQVVPGLEEAIRGMKAGARRRVLVPADLGYDPDIKLGPVPPGFAAKRQVINHRTESLIFEVEVLRVRPGAQ